MKAEIAKFDFYADRVFDERYLIGKLINTLASDQETIPLINMLSQKLTNKSFTGMFGGEELIKVKKDIKNSTLFAQKFHCTGRKYSILK